MSGSHLDNFENSGHVLEVLAEMIMKKMRDSGSGSTVYDSSRKPHTRTNIVEHCLPPETSLPPNCDNDDDISPDSPSSKMTTRPKTGVEPPDNILHGDGLDNLDKPEESGDPILNHGPGLSAYQNYNWMMSGLRKKLNRLAYEFRLLRKGGPAMEVSYDICRSLEMIFVLHSKNLACLYPAEYIPLYVLNAEDATRTENVSVYAGGFCRLSRSSRNLRKLFSGYKNMYDVENLSDSLKNMEQRLNTFATQLTSSIEDLRMDRDLRYQTNDFMQELYADMDAVYKELGKFLDKGVPMIRAVQEQLNSQHNVQLTTIATFFSGVTATVLQITFDARTTPLDEAVNTLLFLSLLFGIASAAHSLLFDAWRRSLILCPEFTLPIWLTGCLIKAPMVYLVLAGMQFYVALCLFVFSSQQGIITRTLVAVFGVIHAVVLVVFSTWLILAKWEFVKTTSNTRQHFPDDLIKTSFIEWVMTSIMQRRRTRHFNDVVSMGLLNRNQSQVSLQTVAEESNWPPESQKRQDTGSTTPWSPAASVRVSNSDADHLVFEPSQAHSTVDMDGQKMHKEITEWCTRLPPTVAPNHPFWSDYDVFNEPLPSAVPSQRFWPLDDPVYRSSSRPGERAGVAPAGEATHTSSRHPMPPQVVNHSVSSEDAESANPTQAKMR